jgi:DNA-binding NarL/FixJ family response regulator
MPVRVKNRRFGWGESMKSAVAEPLPRPSDMSTNSVRPIRRRVPLRQHAGQEAESLVLPAGSLVLIDPQPFTRWLIRDMLAETFPNYRVHEVSTAENLGPSLRYLEPNLIILYIRSAAFSDEFVQRSLDYFSKRNSKAPIIFLSDRIAFTDLNDALARGVRGYIPTSLECDVARAALKLVEAGGTYIPVDVVRDFNRRPRAEQKEDRDWSDLTPRELSVFQLLRKGSPNKVIASQLCMQESTVKVHVRHILKKLHAINRTHAVSIANKLGDDAAQH